ncbi:MAG TPA: glycosyl hydrolase family 28 protein, partial [Polyangia bacterium]|nr:glycosyl hydrolase family 28 protein [Polyangia bacterium]
LLVAGCAPDGGGTEGTGGSTGSQTGGSTGSGTGGSTSGTGTGGSTTGTGGSTSGTGTGGSTTSTGGTTGGGTGGSTSTGGSKGTGGATATGGTTGGTGGTTSTGGSKGTGGATAATGGATGTGGVKGTGGATATGGTTSTGGSSGTCGAGDTNLPAEPTLPSTVCTTLNATQKVTANSTAVASESSPDTSTIQNALNACGSGKAVKLVASGSNNAFLIGPIKVPSGVTLWVDAGVTLYGTRSTSTYGSASALISVSGANAGIVGGGVIDGQGGEPNIGSSSSFWDANGNGGSSPALIQVSSATNFVLYGITLQNSPMFHVKLSAAGFIAWGVTIKTPSKATNSAGTALSYTSAHNTDGIDPGESASNGYIVCSKISDGDDHIAIKGSSSSGVKNLTIAHNHLEAGHGISIGSEFTGGVSEVKVYDISIDQTASGTGGGSSNGLRIKSDSSRGGLVNDVTYSDICMKGVANPIFLTPTYSSSTGSDIPHYTNITFSDIHILSGGNSPTVTLDGYSSSYINSVTLDNVIFDPTPKVTASYTNVTLGPGAVSFTPSGTGVTVTNKVSGTSTPNPCTNKFVTF